MSQIPTISYSYMGLEMRLETLISVQKLGGDPHSICISSSDSSIWTLLSNNQIKSFSPSGTIIHAIGSANQAGLVNGDYNLARFSFSVYSSLCEDPTQPNCFYVSDSANHSIRYIDSKSKIISTIAGSGSMGCVDGPVSEALFSFPTGLMHNSLGYLMIADSGNHRIRLLADNFVYTIAGSGEQGSLNGDPLSSTFNFPVGLALSPNGDIIVSDTYGNTIRSVSAEEVTTIAGKSTTDGKNEKSNQITFSNPSRLGWTAQNELIVCESNSDSLRILITNQDEHQNTRNNPAVYTLVDGSTQKDSKFSPLLSPFDMIISQADKSIIVADKQGVHKLVWRTNSEWKQIDAKTKRASSTVRAPIHLLGKSNQSKPMSSNTSALSLDSISSSEASSSNSLNIHTNTSDMINISPIEEDPLQKRSSTDYIGMSPSSSGSTLNYDAWSSLEKPTILAEITSIVNLIAIILKSLGKDNSRLLSPPAQFCMHIKELVHLFVLVLQKYTVTVIRENDLVAFERMVDCESKLYDQITCIGSYGSNPYGLYTPNNIPTIKAVLVAFKRSLVELDKIMAESSKSDTQPSLSTTSSQGIQLNTETVESPRRSMILEVSDPIVHPTPTPPPLPIPTSQSDTSPRLSLNIGNSEIVNEPNEPEKANLSNTTTQESKRLSLFTSPNNSEIVDIPGVIQKWAPVAKTCAMYHSSNGTIWVATTAHVLINIKDNNPTTIAGQTDSPGYVNGELEVARFKFSRLCGLSETSHGDLLIVDPGNHCVRILNNETQKVYTWAGDNVAAYRDGPMVSARFSYPCGIARGPYDTYYISDTGNNRIRLVIDDTVTTVAGTGQSGYVDGLVKEALFSAPSGLGISPKGDLYIADYHSHVIRKLSTNGTVSTVAGIGLEGYSEGDTKEAQFSNPASLLVTRTEDIIVADYYNHCFRYVSQSAGVVSLFAGSPKQAGYQNGHSLHSSLFSFPTAAIVVPPTRPGQLSSILLADQNQIRELSDYPLPANLQKAEFGSSLTQICWEQDLIAQPPQWILDAISVLHITGVAIRDLWAINSEQHQVLPIVERILAGRPVDWLTTPPRIVATILKAYFQKLPVPLLTMELQDMWIGSCQDLIPTPQNNIPTTTSSKQHATGPTGSTVNTVNTSISNDINVQRTLSLIVPILKSLPLANREMLRLLLELFTAFDNPVQIPPIWGPILLLRKSLGIWKDAVRPASRVVFVLIKYFKYLFNDTTRLYESPAWLTRVNVRNGKIDDYFSTFNSVLVPIQIRLMAVSNKSGFDLTEIFKYIEYCRLLISTMQAAFSSKPIGFVLEQYHLERAYAFIMAFHDAWVKVQDATAISTLTRTNTNTNSTTLLLSSIFSSESESSSPQVTPRNVTSAKVTSSVDPSIPPSSETGSVSVTSSVSNAKTEVIVSNTVDLQSNQTSLLGISEEDEDIPPPPEDDSESSVCEQTSEPTKSSHPLGPEPLLSKVVPQLNLSQMSQKTEQVSSLTPTSASSGRPEDQPSTSRTSAPNTVRVLLASDIESYKDEMLLLRAFRSTDTRATFDRYIAKATYELFLFFVSANIGYRGSLFSDSSYLSSIDKYLKGLKLIDTRTYTIWMSKLRGAPVVSYSKFQEIFLQMFPTTNEEDLKMLKDTLDHQNTGCLPVWHFVEFLKSYGPLEGCIPRLASVYKQPWFVGYATASEAELVLAQEPKTGTFLVRYSSTHPGSYSISKATLVPTSTTDLPTSRTSMVLLNSDTSIKVRHVLIVRTPENSLTASEFTSDSTVSYNSLPELVIDWASQGRLTNPVRENVLKLPGFMGELSEDEANLLLAQSPKGTYLLRTLPSSIQVSSTAGPNSNSESLELSSSSSSSNSNTSPYYSPIYLSIVHTSNSVKHVVFNRETGSEKYSFGDHLFETLAQLIQHFASKIFFSPFIRIPIITTVLDDTEFENLEVPSSKRNSTHQNLASPIKKLPHSNLELIRFKASRILDDDEGDTNSIDFSDATILELSKNEDKPVVLAAQLLANKDILPCETDLVLEHIISSPSPQEAADKLLRPRMRKQTTLSSLLSSKRKDPVRLDEVFLESLGNPLNQLLIISVNIVCTSDRPMQFRIANPSEINSFHFLTVTPNEGTLIKGESNTIKINVVLFKPHSIQKIFRIHVWSADKGFNVTLPFAVRINSSLSALNSPGDQSPYWIIPPHALTDSTVVDSTPNSTLFRSILYGAVVAQKRFKTAIQGGVGGGKHVQVSRANSSGPVLVGTSGGNSNLQTIAHSHHVNEINAFDHELNTMRLYKHDHIMPLVGAHKDKEGLDTYIVMVYASNSTLSNFIKYQESPVASVVSVGVPKTKPVQATSPILIPQLPSQPPDNTNTSPSNENDQTLEKKRSNSRLNASAPRDLFTTARSVFAKEQGGLPSSPLGQQPTESILSASSSSNSSSTTTSELTSSQKLRNRTSSNPPPSGIGKLNIPPQPSSSSPSLAPSLTDTGSTPYLLTSRSNIVLHNTVHPPESKTIAFRISMALDVAGAVLFLHKHNLIHRDINSLTLLVDHSYGVSLADFGEIRQVSTIMTLDKGTYKYRAPEISTRVYTNKVDIYSLGLCLMELMGAEIPILPQTLTPDKFKIPTLPPNVPESIVSLLRDCCLRNPEARPSALQVVRRLSNARKEYLEAVGRQRLSPRSKLFKKSHTDASSLSQ